MTTSEIRFTPGEDHGLAGDGVLCLGEDCHAHADQRATSEILVSLHQLLAACVEASCHTASAPSDQYFFHFVFSLSSFRILSSSSISILLAKRTAASLYRFVLCSQDNGQVVPQQRSSSGMRRKSSSSSHIHPNL